MADISILRLHSCDLKHTSNVPWTGFAAIAQEYKINDPDTFIDRLIDIANAGTTTSMDVRPTLSTLSKANWAAYALLAFVGSHTLSEPVNFYANQTVSRPQVQVPQQPQ